MKLSTTIKNMILRYPSLFQDRAQCLDQLFCVNGNGYEWQNGQLVTIEYEGRRSNEREWPNDEDRIEAMLQQNPYKRIIVKGGVDREYKFSEFTQRMLYDYFRQNRATKNYKQVMMPGFHDWISPSFRFYPISKYSKMLNLPNDICDDWMAGAEETLALLKKYGCPEEHKIDVSKLELKFEDE